MAKNDFALGLMVGAAVGAAMALLYAPAPGEVTRSSVKEKATELGHDYGATAKEKAGEAYSKAKESAGHFGSSLSEKLAEAKEKIATLAEDVKHRTAKAVDEVVDETETLTAKAEDVIRDGAGESA